MKTSDPHPDPLDSPPGDSDAGGRKHKDVELTSPGEVTRLLLEMQDGNRGAEERLIPLVYDELRRLAGSYLRKERRDHTLQATGLVHEAYLRLVEQRAPWHSRAHFFGIAARLMRRILVDYARAHQASKRGGDNVKVPLDEALLLSSADSQHLLDLDLAISRLTEVDERAAKVFTLRFFGGLSVSETAELLQVGSRSVNRDWRMAQAWLRRELEA